MARESSRKFRSAAVVCSMMLASCPTARANVVGDAVPAPAQVEARTVSTITARQTRTSWTLTFSGMIVPRDEIAVGPPFQAQPIASVEVELGDRVAAGQVLVRLDTAQLENRLRETQGRVARSQAALRQQEIALAQARDRLERSTRLQASGTVTDQDHSERISAVATAEYAVSLQQAERQEAEAQLAEIHRQIERADVRAPAAGTVSERLARTGALAGTDPLVRLIRDGEVEFSAEIPESDLGNIRAGQPATVTVSSGQSAIAGEVRVVAPKVDPATRLGTARITLHAPGPLFAGMFGRAEVTVDHGDAITIEDTALVYGPEAGESAVFVVADGRVRRQPVTTGRRKSGKVEIVGGLEAGDKVVARSGAWLRDGDAVNPVEVPAPGGEWR